MKIHRVDNKDLSDISFRFYWFVVIAYIVFQLVSDVTAGKVISLGPAVVSVTVLYFPITYIISDVLTEVYGFSQARRALWIVMAGSVAAGLIYQLVVILPPGPGFTSNDAYVTVFGQVPRILVGGWIAVIVGDLANNYLLSRIKVWTAGKYLWLRTISSTFVGQGLNTGLFYIIALGGVLPNNILISAIFWGWAIKVAVEVVLTPLTYLVVGWLKRAEGIDTFDYSEKYKVFRI